MHALAGRREYIPVGLTAASLLPTPASGRTRYLPLPRSKENKVQRESETLATRIEDYPLRSCEMSRTAPRAAEVVSNA